MFFKLLDEKEARAIMSGGDQFFRCVNNQAYLIPGGYNIDKRWEKIAGLAGVSLEIAHKLMQADPHLFFTGDEKDVVKAIHDNTCLDEKLS